MLLPSKFVMAGVRSVALHRGFPAAAALQAHALTVVSPLSKPQHQFPHHLRMVISRQYSSPASSATDSETNLLDKAPDYGSTFTLPPSVTDAATSSLTELGLGGYWPPGLMQHTLDYLHSLGLPWWSCIVAVACVVRPFMIPLFASVQRNSIHMVNHAPELQQFQMKTLAAQNVGDRVGISRIMKEQQEYMRKNDINLFRQFRLIACQGVVFSSMFFGLRGMVELPIESFKTGGLLHIVDLTVRDPYFILPCIVSSTLFFILRSGAEGIHLDHLPPLARNVMYYGGPLIAFFSVAYFPSALGIYWVVSNFISVGQFFLFNSEFGKRIFRIPEKKPLPEVCIFLSKTCLTHVVTKLPFITTNVTDLSARESHN